MLISPKASQKKMQHVPKPWPRNIKPKTFSKDRQALSAASRVTEYRMIPGLQHRSNKEPELQLVGRGEASSCKTSGQLNLKARRQTSLLVVYAQYFIGCMHAMTENKTTHTQRQHAAWLQKGRCCNYASTRDMQQLGSGKTGLSTKNASKQNTYCSSLPHALEPTPDKRKPKSTASQQRLLLVRIAPRSDVNMASLRKFASGSGPFPLHTCRIAPWLLGGRGLFLGFFTSWPGKKRKAKHKGEATCKVKGMQEAMLRVLHCIDRCLG